MDPYKKKKKWRKSSQVLGRCKLLENTTSKIQSEFPDLLQNQHKKQKVHC